tara:strand:+ start:204 stop:365 length:162 start_codon:yes stop_codon:yes gene_type:complete
VKKVAVVAVVAVVTTEAAEALMSREGRSLIRGLVPLLKTYSLVVLVPKPVFNR